MRRDETGERKRRGTETLERGNGTSRKGDREVKRGAAESDV